MKSEEQPDYAFEIKTQKVFFIPPIVSGFSIENS